MKKPPIAQLLDIKHGKPVPVVGVRVEGAISGAIGELELIQVFRNEESHPIEAVYLFPLDDAAVLNALSVEIGDRRIEGKVEEREAAFEKYDDALADGHGGFLVDQERGDIYRVSVGALMPGQEATLRLRFASELMREDDAFRCTIPTTVGARYIPPAMPPQLGESAGEVLNPPRRASVPYGLSLKVDVEMPGGISSVESPTHPIRFSLSGTGATVELGAESAPMDRNLVLIFRGRDTPEASCAIQQTEEGERFAMVQLTPRFGEDAAEQGHEVIFLLDCSGSMRGESIAAARRTLALCLRSLEATDSFNILCFGTTSRTLFPSSRPFDEESFAVANEHIASIDANLGGTEIFAPLAFAMKAQADSDRARQIVLITDGQVANEKELIEFARQHQDRARIFSFGIGHGASSFLVRGLANATRGSSEMIAPSERIESKVMRTFRRVRSPSLRDLSLSFEGCSGEPARSTLPPVFEGDSMTVFAKLTEGEGQRVVLKAGKWEFAAALDGSTQVSGGAIASLWARARVRELLAGPTTGSAQTRGDRQTRKKKQATELALKHQIMCELTSFVAVEVREEKNTQPVVLRKVPIANLANAPFGGARMDMMTMSLAAPGAPPAARKKSRRRPKSAPRPQMARSAMAPPSAPRRPAPMAARSAPAMASPMAAGTSGPALGGGGLGSDGSDESKIVNCLMTQSIRGSFPKSAALDEICLVEEKERLKEVIAQRGEEAAVTALVVHILTTRFKGHRDLWALAVKKAKRWLSESQAAEWTA